MSQASASSQAPARHGPRTVAMVEVDAENAKSVYRIEVPCRTGRQLSMLSRDRRSICSLRSKPDEKAVPAPATIKTRTPESRSISSRAVPISLSMAAFSALARSGRLSGGGQPDRFSRPQLLESAQSCDRSPLSGRFGRLTPEVSDKFQAVPRKWLQAGRCL